LQIEIAGDDEQVLALRIHGHADREVDFVRGDIEALPGTKASAEEEGRD
jgi:hypothetical protein